MPDRLTLKTERETWYPMSVYNLEQHLEILVTGNAHFSLTEARPIRKNIAYSLQYIEFLNRVLNDIALSSVLWTQNVKSFLIHGAALVEAIFNFLVISKGHGKTTNWKSVTSHNTPEYAIGTSTYRNETEIFEKINSSLRVQMTFDQLAKKVESKKLLGDNFPAYTKIKPLRQLRNKIHIHDSENPTDTDWHNFNQREYLLVCTVLHAVLTSEVFAGSAHFSKFDYLLASNNQIQPAEDTTSD